MAILRREARDLMSRGYEMGATVLNGTVERAADGTWRVDGRSLEEILSELEGCEVALVAAAIGEGAGVKHICRVCGTEYQEHTCPRCREIRRRLRGRE
jgi:rubrerythrin